MFLIISLNIKKNISVNLGHTLNEYERDFQKSKWFSEIYIFNCLLLFYFSSVQSLLCPTLCNPMDCSMPAFPILHYLLEFAQIHVH